MASRNALANALYAKRISMGLSPREAALDANVSHSTFARAENADTMPAGENFFRLAAWCGLLSDQEEEKDTLEAVTLALLKDGLLTSVQAETMVRIVSDLYAVFTAT